MSEEDGKSFAILHAKAFEWWCELTEELREEVVFEAYLARCGIKYEDVK